MREEITRTSPTFRGILADLDERGIIRIGAEVTAAGDILVGKVAFRRVRPSDSEERSSARREGPRGARHLRVPTAKRDVIMSVEFTDDDDLNPGVRLVTVRAPCRPATQDHDRRQDGHQQAGAVSAILPVEDMPSSLTAILVDYHLNPLGVPGRMNVGQVLEHSGGWPTRAGCFGRRGRRRVGGAPAC